MATLSQYLLVIVIVMVMVLLGPCIVVSLIILVFVRYVLFSNSIELILNFLVWVGDTRHDLHH